MIREAGEAIGLYISHVPGKCIRKLKFFPQLYSLLPGNALASIFPNILKSGHNHKIARFIE